MRDGVEADGMARQIKGWVTVYPVFVGPIDLSKGFDPEKNGVRIRMRLLNEIDVDITDWEFRDVTPGRTPFTLDSSEASTTPAPGTYDNALICIMAQKTDEPNPIGLNIPIKLVVEG